jgi:dihydroxy-acid dehydratase
MMVGYVSPEAAAGGTIALVRNGDLIQMDAKSGTIALDVAARRTRAPAQDSARCRARAACRARWKNTRRSSARRSAVR